MPRVYATPRAGEDSDAHATPLTMKIARNARIAVSSRMVNVRITAAGQQLLGERRAEWAGRVGELLGRLPAEEQAAIAAALPAFRRFLAHPPAGD